jgi:hypothetical protein
LRNERCGEWTSDIHISTVDQVPNPRMAYMVAKNKERKHARRARLIEMLGGVFVRCGTTEDLVFDHVDPSTKRFTIGGNLDRWWADLLEESSRCQLLCQEPCHREKGTEDRPESPHGTIYRYSDLGCRCAECRAATAAKSAARRARRKAAVDDQRLGIPVADLARAMRAAGLHDQLTEAQAKGWTADPETAPEWFAVLRGERPARAAGREYRRQQEAGQRELLELAAGQSAWAKVQAGKRWFSGVEWPYAQDWAFRAAKELVRTGPDREVSDEERQVLRAVGAGADDHATWPVHAGGCDGEGREHCAVRIEQMRASRRADALIESVAKETALRDLAVSSGMFVTCWHGSRVGLVVKTSTNKVTVRVRLIGGQGDRHAVAGKNLDPRYAQLAPASLPAPPTPGGEVVLRDHGGHIRQASVAGVDGPCSRRPTRSNQASGAVDGPACWRSSQGQARRE